MAFKCIHDASFPSASTFQCFVCVYKSHASKLSAYYKPSASVLPLITHSFRRQPGQPESVMVLGHRLAATSIWLLAPRFRARGVGPAGIPGSGAPAVSGVGVQLLDSIVGVPWSDIVPTLSKGPFLPLTAALIPLCRKTGA